MKLAVIIPAMNEEASIGKVLEDLRAHCQCTVVVVDDASTDTTARVARQNDAIVLSHVTNLGAWRATQTGIRYALQNDFDAVVTMDGDGQHSGKDLQLLLDKGNEGYDLVIGSCTSRGSTGRHIAWRVFKTLAGLSVDDLTSGFRFYGRVAIEALATRQATMFEYQDVGVLIMMRHLDLKSTEVTVQMKEREDGISRIFHSWMAVARYLMYTTILSGSKVFPMSSETYKKKLIAGGNLE